MNDMLTCSNCGGAISLDGRFCGSCGTPVPSPLPSEAEPSPSAPVATVTALELPEPAPVTVEGPTSTAPAPVEQQAPPVLVQRGRAGSRFLPRTVPAPPEDGVIVARNVLGSRATTKPQTSRERKIAGDLPDWEPLPPGELLVRRSGA